MKNAIFATLAAATLTAAASAQQITVSIAGGWTVTPISRNNYVPFNQSNGSGGVIIGGVLANAGSSSSGWYTQGSATMQGYNVAGATVAVGTSMSPVSTTAGVTEFYTNASGNGTVLVTLSAQPDQAIARLRGSGYSGTVTATVAVTCPYFGWLTASASASAVAPPAMPTTQTLPVTASALVFGQSAFSLNMNSGASAWGALPAGSQMLLYAGANASGTVTLN